MILRAISHLQPLRSPFRIDSLSSRFARRYPRGCTVSVARPTRSIPNSALPLLLSTLKARPRAGALRYGAFESPASRWRPVLRLLPLSSVLCLLTSVVLAPSAQAYEPQNSGIWESSLAERAFNTGPSWFSAGPAWLMNAMPGANFRARRYVIDSAGDREESTTEAPYVGTLHDVFNVSLFNNIATFGTASAASTISKTPTPTIADADTTYIYNGTATNTSGTADQWSAGTNWSATPVGAVDTTLTFGTGPLAAAVTVFTNNDIAGNFQLNILNFTYAGPASGTKPTVTISGNQLEFISNGVTTPTMSIAATGTIMPLLTISNNLLLTNNLSISASSDGILSGMISGTASLTKTGAGTLTLSGTNTYNGATTITGGILEFAKEVSLYNNTTASWTATNIVVQSGATAAFNVGGTGEFTSADIDILKGLSASATTGFESGSFLGLDTTNAGGTFTYNSGIANTNGGANVLGVTKLGTGLLLLSGANTYTGPTTIAAGELFLSPSGSLASTSTIRVGDTIANSPSAMFTFGATGGGTTLANPMTVQASASGSQGTRTLLGLADSGNTNTYSGTITMNAGLTVQSAAVGSTVANGQGILLFQGGSIDVGTSTLTVNTNLRGNNADTYSIQGIVNINEVLGSSQATGGSLVKDGSGTLILQGTSNNYTGTNAAALNPNGTRIGGGILGIFGDGSLGLAPSTATNNVFFTTPGTNVNGDSIEPTLRADASTVTLAATRNINIDSGVTARFDSNGNTFTIAGNINGAGNLNKVGLGTLVLTGNNTYSGTTLISAGTLNAAAAGALGGTTGSITVNNGGTLAVSGTGNLDRINNSTNIVLGNGSGNATFVRSGSGIVSEGSGATNTGGTIAGTSSIGLGALTLQSNATLNFGTAGVGTFTFASFTANANTLNILNWTSNANFSTTTSGVDGTDDRLIFGGTLPPATAFITFNGAASTVIPLDTGFYEVVPLTPIPEPSTWVGAALALGAIAFAQRRRLRSYLLSVIG